MLASEGIAKPRMTEMNRPQVFAWRLRSARGRVRAGKSHAGDCAGGAGQPTFLPRGRTKRSETVNKNPSLEGPQFVQFFGPVLDALRELGGSARPVEVCTKVAANLELSDQAQEELLDSGSSRFANRVAWARFYLAKAGFIDSSRRGVWTLTDQGRTAVLSHSESVAVFREIHGQFQTSRRNTEPDVVDETSSPDDESEALDSYRRVVSRTLQELPPDGFERFCQRLLREAGFQDVAVTGRSGDGGIDGIGMLQVNALVSFKVLFQCKRYQGSVGAAQVRDFRGAMQGRADKGIIITTGSFTSEARKEAVRDGVPPIELVDGEKLITMLEDLELGLAPIRAFRVDDDFFDDYR
jgi:restriction system protein